MIWFTSDPHYFHKNVIEYCGRPFMDVNHMNEMLIKKYNALVRPEDTCYFLGDVIFGGTLKAHEIISQLNGTKKLILGNHDKQNKAHKWLTLGFKVARDHEQIQLTPEILLNLSHFPYRGDNHDERKFPTQLEDDGRWLLHGHVHNAWKTKGRMINVGVDVWDFNPVSINSIKEMIGVR